MGFSTFIDVATTKLHVDCKPNVAMPIQMPSGVQAGDQLVAFINGAFPGFVTFPPGWTGTLSTGLWTKTADGSEDGAVLNWYTQDRTEIFNDSFTLVVVAHVLCYRFNTPTFAPPNKEFRFFGGGSASSDTVTILDIPPGRVTPTGSDGLVAGTCLRIECAYGGAFTTPFDINSGEELSSIEWTNPTDRTGMDSLSDFSSHIGTPSCISQSVADIEYNFPPPFAVYNPHDSVTATAAGSIDIAVHVYTVQYNFPGFYAAAYWGINASTPF